VFPDGKAVIIRPLTGLKEHIREPVPIETIRVVLQPQHTSKHETNKNIPHKRQVKGETLPGALSSGGPE